MENIRFNVGRGQRLVLFFCVAFVCLLAASVLVFVLGNGTTPKVRIGAVLQDVIAFAVPAIIVAVLVTRRPDDLLLIRRPRMQVAVYMVMALVVAMPALNAIVEWNASLPLPESVFADAEQQKKVIETLFGGASVGSLTAAILIIGLMAPLTEELLFRGCLQRILASVAGRDVAVWIAAAIFSLMHFDLTGFFPRLILGVIFGYGMIWSGSLWTAVVCHAVNNCLAVIAMWLEMKGNEVGAEMQTVGASNITLILLSCTSFAFLMWMARRNGVSQTACG